MAGARKTLNNRPERLVPPVNRDEQRRLLTDLLRGVSRSFYLTLKVLPTRLREPMGLAYLLARAADTVADARLLPSGDRLRHLTALREQVEGGLEVPALDEIRGSLTDAPCNPHERALLASLPQALSMLEGLPEGDRLLVRSIVETLMRAMEIDLTRFPAEDTGKLGCLSDAGELDTYVYYAAGCVGEFWTDIAMAHTAALRRWDRERMAGLGVRFGKALQLTNILRDVPRDLRIGRCYLPAVELAEAGLVPEDLLRTEATARARPVLCRWIGAALEHYAAAEEYIRATPRRCVRLRLATILPVVIGLATLERLASNRSWLDPATPSRVSRRWVRSVLPRSLPCALSNTALGLWLGHLRRKVEAGIGNVTS